MTKIARRNNKKETYDIPRRRLKLLKKLCNRKRRHLTKNSDINIKVIHCLPSSLEVFDRFW